MNFLKRLTIADYLSFAGLFCAWISIMLIIEGRPNMAIPVNMAAFVFDILDGFAARRFKQASCIGRQIDSYVDVFIYLVFSALFFMKYLSPNMIVSAVIGFLIILFGGLRLIRFNNEGILKTDCGRDYYRGVTTVHVSFLIIIMYFLTGFIGNMNKWALSAIITFLCPAMLSNFKSYKIKNYWWFGLIIIIFVFLSAVLEYANFK